MPRRRSAPTLLLAAVAFGVLMGLVKGDADGLRAGVGNLSAPWLLVAFLPATTCGSARRGAAVGLASTMAALLGFYAALTVGLSGHLGGGGFAAELVSELTANRVYLVFGLLSGPAAGAVGGWVGRRHPAARWPLAGAVLAAEIGAVALARGRQLSPAPLYFSWAVDDWTPYVVEALLGLAVVAVALRRARQTGR